MMIAPTRVIRGSLPFITYSFSSPLLRPTRFQYESPFRMTARLILRVFKHLPHQERCLQVLSFLNTKHFVWIMLKYILPTKLDDPVLVTRRQDRNLLQREMKKVSYHLHFDR